MEEKTKSELRDTAVEIIFERANLKELGFRRTKAAFKRKYGDFLDLITFGSSRSSNLDDDTNILEIRAHVTNSKFKKFQNEELGLSYLDGIVAGGIIENLDVDGPPYIRYNIGISTESMQESITRIVEVIKKTCLPFFDLCRDVDSVIDNVHKEAFLPLQRKIEYCIFLNRTDLIDKMLENMTNHNPSFMDYLKEYIHEIETNGVPQHEFFSNASGNEDRVSAGNVAIRLHQLNIETTFHKK